MSDKTEHFFEGKPDGRQAGDIAVSRFRPRYRALTPYEKALHDEIKAKAEESDLIARLEAATEGSSELDEAITATVLPNDAEEMRFAGITPNYSRSLDAALTLLPKTATNRHLFSFGGHGRRDVEGDCWGFKIHDRAQLVGSERAARHIECLKPSFQIDGQPRVMLEKAIAERFCEFSTTHAATAATAICLTALKCKAGRTTDDDLWPKTTAIKVRSQT